MLLRRYGIVFREMLARKTIVPKWRELLITMRRLEDRGEIRGGRFVSGFLGEQFALPLAVESLRATRNLTKTGDTVMFRSRSARSGRHRCAWRPRRGKFWPNGCVSGRRRSAAERTSRCNGARSQPNRRSIEQIPGLRGYVGDF